MLFGSVVTEFVRVSEHAVPLGVVSHYLRVALFVRLMRPDAFLDVRVAGFGRGLMRSGPAGRGGRYRTRTYDLVRVKHAL